MAYIINYPLSLVCSGFATNVALNTLYQFTGLYGITVPIVYMEAYPCYRSEPWPMLYCSEQDNRLLTQVHHTAIRKGERSRSGMTVFAMFQTMYAIAHGSF